MQLYKNIEDKGKFKILSPHNNEELIGTVSIPNDGKCIITIWNADTNKLDWNYNTFNMFGVLSESGNCIFNDCFISSHSNREIEIIANNVILGLNSEILDSISEEDNYYFNGIQFRFDNIELWTHCRNTFEVEKDDNDGSINVKCKPRKDIIIYENKNIIIQAIFYYKHPGFPIIKDATISETPYIEIICKENKKLSIDELLEYLYYTSTFIDFSIGSISNIIEILLISKNLNGRKYTSKYITNITTKGPMDKQTWFSINFSLDSISKERDSRYLENWLDNFEKIRPSIELYRNYKIIEKNSTESKFLWLAQAVESLHRRTHSGTQIPIEEYQKMKDTLINICPIEYLDWLKPKLEYGNEASFRKRLNEIIEPLWEIIDNQSYNIQESMFTDSIKKSYISKIMTYRNEFTHYDPRNKPLTLEEALKIIVITKLLEITLYLQIYMLLGFSASTLIELIAKGNSNLGKLLREFRCQTKLYWT